MASLLVWSGVRSAQAAAGRDGWARVEAESYDASGGSLQVCSGVLCYLAANSWTQYNGVDLHSGTDTVQLNVANGGGSSAVQVWVGGVNVGTLTVAGTGGWNTYQTKSLTLPAQSGVKDVKLVFVNGNLNVDWLSFTGTGASPSPSTSSPPPPSGSTVFATNAGGPAFTAGDGTVFAADKGFSGGSTYAKTVAIGGTNDDTLFQTERYGNFTYSTAVANGTYTVSLYFAEVYFTAAGKRSFDVLMEGTEQISDLDIYARVGANTAYVTQTTVAVGDGTLNLQFVSNVDNAKVSAIKVTGGTVSGPTAVFTTSPSAPTTGQAVTFDASASTSNATITGYAWNFGDNTTGTGKTTTHTYTNTGTYQTTLTITDSNGKTATTSVSVSVGIVTPPGPNPLKPRIVVLTDISSWEPDDHESLTRLLAHADMFEIEAIVLTTGWSIDTLNDPTKSGFINIINSTIDAYGRDLPNLMRRSGQSGNTLDNTRQPIGYWPSAQYLKDRTMTGSRNRGVQFLGANNDSPGSNKIISLADENDDRPLYVEFWGGGNTLGQSIWRVKQDRTAAQFDTFVRKVRAYAITDQDRGQNESTSVSSHGWMRSAANGNLQFIWDECAWGYQNGTGKANWNQYATDIQGHGNLGAQYPKYVYGVEGDTPSFLFAMPTGLNDPSSPNQASWGGTYKNSGGGLWQPASSCGTYNARFYPASYNNFAARMDWAQSGSGNRNPNVVLDGDSGVSIVTKTPRQGTAVTLDASRTTDPDGNSLRYTWWVQTDAGTYPGSVNIANSSSSIATVNVPADAAGKTFQVILEVTDNGTHNLSSYRRIIFAPTS